MMSNKWITLWFVVLVMHFFTAVSTVTYPWLAALKLTGVLIAAALFMHGLLEALRPTKQPAEHTAPDQLIKENRLAARAV